MVTISSARVGLIGFCFSLFFSVISSSYGQSPEASEDKKVIINFDDGFKSQIVNAKPILDKYGFKAAYFIVCNFVGKDNSKQRIVIIDWNYEVNIRIVN